MVFLKAPVAPPVTMGINRESRAYALGSYVSLSRAYEHLYVSPKVDIFWIEYEMVLEEIYLPELERRAPGMEDEEWHKLTGPRCLENKKLLGFLGKEVKRREEERWRQDAADIAGGKDSPPKTGPPLSRVRELLATAEARTELQLEQRKDWLEAQKPRVR